MPHRLPGIKVNIYIFLDFTHWTGVVDIVCEGKVG